MPEGKKADAIYCSKTCQKADYSALEKAGRLDLKRDRPPCQHCGKAIPAEAQANRIFCSVYCQRRGIYHRNKTARQRICVVCDAPYLASIETQQTCGKICSSEHKREKEPRPCKHCGAAMERPLPEKKFCNKRCQDRWHKAKRKDREKFV